MNDLTKSKIMSMSFDIIDDILPSCIKKDEESTREAIKKALTDRLDSTTDKLEREAIIKAYSTLKDLSFDYLKELYEVIADFDRNPNLVDARFYASDEPIRAKAYESQVGDHIAIKNKQGEDEYFELVLRFIYVGDIYIGLRPLFDSDEKYRFYRYIFSDYPEDDQMILIVDNDKKVELIKEMEELLNLDTEE